jgi:NAD(P)-dependent dehydrogenase (short-subunit alcohol dehydrogenase family)
MQNDNLTGRVALITGASRGLGKAMALALAGAGARVALVGRDMDALQASAAEIAAQGGEAKVFRADVASEQQVALLEREVSDTLGPIDILINNAGMNIRKPLLEFTLEEWERVIGTNLTSAFLMCRAFVPRMKGRGFGRIINLGSTMSHVSMPHRSAYSSSKAALLGLTRALALELAPEQITVVAISPGPFATEMNTPLLENAELNQFFMSRVALGRWGKVDEVGKLAVFLCSDGASFITGTDILIDGGWCAQ